MGKKAIIVAGGWPGHEPEKVSVRFKKMLENEGFEVNIHNELEVYGDKEYLMQTAAAGAEKAARIANRTLTKAKKKVGLLLG